jgi:ankyrin repeat protein
VEKLLALGASPLTPIPREGEPRSPLCIAASVGATACLERLLCVDDPSRVVGHTLPIREAIRNNHLDCVQLLVHHTKTVGVYENDTGFLSTGLHDAVVSNSILIVNAMLCCNLDTQNSPSDMTALLVACTMGHVNIALALIEGGANVRLPGINGFTPLIAAIKHGALPVIKALLERGADVDDVYYDLSAVTHAVFTRNVDVVALLLKWGASINHNEQLDFLDGVDNPAMVSFFAVNRVRYVHGAHTTALHIAAAENNFTLGLELLRAGACPFLGPSVEPFIKTARLCWHKSRHHSYGPRARMAIVLTFWIARNCNSLPWNVWEAVREYVPRRDF